MKLKNLFLILLLAVASAGTIAAQDKYDLAVVGYYRCARPAFAYLYQWR
jgi:cytochrome c biogenesis protein ResB